MTNSIKPNQSFMATGLEEFHTLSSKPDLGKGATASVYKATHRTNGNEYALKLFNFPKNQKILEEQ